MVVSRDLKDAQWLHEHGDIQLNLTDDAVLHR
jgi:hypothetical protein